MISQASYLNALHLKKKFKALKAFELVKSQNKNILIHVEMRINIVQLLSFRLFEPRLSWQL